MDLILGQEGPLEEEMPTHSNILAWEIACLAGYSITHVIAKELDTT